MTQSVVDAEEYDRPEISYPEDLIPKRKRAAGEDSNSDEEFDQPRKRQRIVADP